MLATMYANDDYKEQRKAAVSKSKYDKIIVYNLLLIFHLGIQGFFRVSYSVSLPDFQGMLSHADSTEAVLIFIKKMEV